jgi:hypothetical protein
MDRKTATTLGVAMLGCIAMMLTVIGGLYGFNTFAGGAQDVQAQSSDTGPNWTVTTVSPDGNRQYIVVVTQDTNPFIDEEGPTRQMSVYELHARGNGTAQLWFVAARVLEYDSKIADFGDSDARRNWGPREVQAGIREHTGESSDTSRRKGRRGGSDD